MKKGLWHQYSSLAYLAVLLGVIGHASSEFVAVLTQVKGPELSVWRFLLGGLGLIGLSLIFPASRNLIEPFKKIGVRLIALSMLGVTIGYLLFHWSLDYATVPQVATMVTTIPIFVGLANLWLTKQPFSKTKMITGCCALLGVALLITDGYLAKLAGSGQSLIGVVMVIGCAAAVAVYTVMIRPVIAEYGALRITAVTMSIGAVGLWLVVGLFWQIWVNPFTLFDRSPQQLASLLTLAMWNTTITQFFWIGGLAAVPDITRGSYLFFLKPVIASVLAIVFLSQTPTAWQSLAIAVICLSVLVEASVALRKPAPA
ncbi:MAG: DMT family transporter [Desulfobacteraceae bacterium]